MNLNSCDWCVSFIAVPVGCSRSGLLSCSSPVLVFLDHGHQCFWNFNSTISVDVVRVKSYVNCLFDPEAIGAHVMKSASLYSQKMSQKSEKMKLFGPVKDEADEDEHNDEDKDKGKGENKGKEDEEDKSGIKGCKNKRNKKKKV